jgi:hypothetical protein
MTTVEHEALPGERQRLVDRIAERDATIARLEAEVERKDAALKYYADEHRQHPTSGPWGVNSTDFGKVARAALNPSQEPRT